MLTRELGLAQYDFRHGRLLPDRLTRGRHGQYLAYAEQMVAIYRRGVGATRRDLHQAVERVFADEDDCPARRIRAFCKLLDDVSAYEQDPRGKAARLRLDVFRRAARLHPLVERPDRLFENDEQQAKASIAAELGTTWEAIDRELFADIIEYQRLRAFDPNLDAGGLLARYNVAQVQVALFSAEVLTIWARQDFKTILRYAKLAGLMHTIDATASGYRIRLDGPASILRETRRYGVNMAKFLPALIACRDWRLHARLNLGRQSLRLHLELRDTDGLHSHLPPPEDFDSDIERQFAEKWGTGPREGWTLHREQEVLWRNQRVFVPDFSLRHQDGRKVLLEIVGFWTPEYLQAKLLTLREFPDERILLAVAAPGVAALQEFAERCIVYKTVLKIADVLARLEQLPAPPADPPNPSTKPDTP